MTCDTLAAGPLLVASQTHNPLAVPMATLLQRLPWLMFGLYAGVVADRINRRAIVITTGLIRMVILLLLTASILTHRVSTVPTEFQGRVASVYLTGVVGGIVIGSAFGGLVASVWGITAPFWFAFVGSAIILALIWRSLSQIAHSDENLRAHASAAQA
jgi:MFS family permease